MYQIKGIEAIATVTELRSKTSQLLEHARSSKSGVLIQKNNEPYAVLLSYEKYLELIGEKPEQVVVEPPRRRRRKKAAETNAG